MCYPRGEFLIGDRDVKLGEIGGAPSISAARNTNSGSTPIYHRCRAGARRNVFARQWPGAAVPHPFGDLRAAGRRGDERESSESTPEPSLAKSRRRALTGSSPLRSSGPGRARSGSPAPQPSGLHVFSISSPRARRRLSPPQQCQRLSRPSQAMARPVQRRGHQILPTISAGAAPSKPWRRNHATNWIRRNGNGRMYTCEPRSQPRMRRRVCRRRGARSGRWRWNAQDPPWPRKLGRGRGGPRAAAAPGGSGTKASRPITLSVVTRRPNASVIGSLSSRIHGNSATP